MAGYYEAKHSTLLDRGARSTQIGTVGRYLDIQRFAACRRPSGIDYESEGDKSTSRDGSMVGNLTSEIRAVFVLPPKLHSPAMPSVVRNRVGELIGRARFLTIKMHLSSASLG